MEMEMVVNAHWLLVTGNWQLVTGGQQLEPTATCPRGGRQTLLLIITKHREK